MNLLRAFVLLVLILALGCGGGPTTTTTQTNKTGTEFRRLCQAVGATNNQISREQFLAAAKHKEVAAKLFDACDVYHTGYITEQQAEQNPYSFQNLKSQVILFQTPRP